MRVSSRAASGRHKIRVRSNLWTTMDRYAKLRQLSPTTLLFCPLFTRRKRGITFSLSYTATDSATAYLQTGKRSSVFRPSAQVHIATHIASAGAPERKKGPYYRVKGPVWLPPFRIFMSLLCRLVNTCEDCKKESAAERSQSRRGNL